MSQQEAMICAFLAQHTLRLDLAPHFVKLAQALSSDHKALQTLSMERFSATYKLKHGLHEVTRKRIINKMRTTPFSINLDEATSKSNKKRVLNILVCYFDADIGESVTHLYASLEMTTVNASTVHAGVTGKLAEDGIALENLISSLSDSAAYMRGSQHGYETKLREDAPHLLEIDGDICHHIRNITRHFSSQLDPDNTLTRLLDDMHTDFVYSPDIKEHFFNICKVLGLPEKQPKERVGHRWLSLLDSTLSFEELADPLTILYFSWLSVEDKLLFQKRMCGILVKYEVSAAGRHTIMTTMSKLKEKTKSMTVLGKKRKERVCHKLFDKRSDIDLLSKAITSIFPMFKNFILAFETKKPMVHKLHDRVVGLFKGFLQAFVKAQHLRECDKNLLHLDVSDQSKQVNPKHISVGKCENVLAHMSTECALSFKEKLMSAYVSTAKYMQKKLPLGNSVLKTLSLLDPIAFGQSETAVLLRKLPSFFPTINAPDFNEEIMKLQSDMDINTGEDADLDAWWSSVFKLHKYPSVEKVVTACLSIFSGPRVEQSFSIMNNIITTKTSSLNINTYEAILCVKYMLLAQNTTVIKLYSRADAVFSPVDASLAWHLQTSFSRYRKYMEKKKSEAAEKEKEKGCKRPQIESNLTSLPSNKKQKRC